MSNEEDVQFKARCLGYSLHNLLKKHGIDCDILAPTTMDSSSKKQRRKKCLLGCQITCVNLANNTYIVVYFLDDLKKSLKKIKQQIKAFYYVTIVSTKENPIGQLCIGNS